MKRENLFYLIMILTILITRISVLIIPEVDIKLFGIIIHHFWFGVILLLIAFLVPKTNMKVFLFAIGIGLMIDQLIFMILGAGKDREYWALPSLLGAIILAFIIYPVRLKLVNLFLKSGLSPLHFP